MASFYARFAMVPPVGKKPMFHTFGIPNYVTVGNVATLTTAEMAIDVAMQRIGNIDVLSLEIFNEDGTLVKPVPISPTNQGAQK